MEVTTWPEPISVNEQRPAVREYVLVFYEHKRKPYDSNFPESGWGIGFDQGWAGFVICAPRTYLQCGPYVTHWLPLPPAP